MDKMPLIAFGVALALAACSESPPPGTPAVDDTVLTATETSRDVGDYTIHFNAMNTDQLTAEVASRYGIARSRNRAMLTVNVLRDEPGGGTSPARAEVSASATNLSGQLRNLTLREVTESGAIYYIGETAITNAETLIFTIQVRPEGEEQSHTIRYMKQFFVD